MISISEETAKRLMKVIAQQPMMVARLAQIECEGLLSELQESLDAAKADEQEKEVNG